MKSKNEIKNNSYFLTYIRFNNNWSIKKIKNKQRYTQQNNHSSEYQNTHTVTTT